MWLEECKNSSPKTITMILVGNKDDLESKREVNFEEGKEMADKHNMMFFETSAKTGHNIDEAFQKSAKEISSKIESNYYDLSNEICGIKKGMNSKSQNISLDNKSSDKKKKGCC